MFQNWVMTDPILYLSMLLGLGGVYVLISSFHDDDDGDDDGEKYIYNLEVTNLAKWLMYLLGYSFESELLAITEMTLNLKLYGSGGDIVFRF